MSSDYQLEDTLYIPFTTRAFATGIPTVLAGSPAISCYRDANLTQFTTGITLTVDLDSIVGLNMLTIVATAANNYVAGETYTIIIATGTVATVSVVGEVVAHFTLDMSAAAKDLANATDGLGAIKAETALIVADTNELQTDDVPGLIATLDAVVDTVKAETVLILADTAVIGAAGAGLTDLGGMSTTMKAQVNAEADTAWTTQMADSTVADGTIATREQALLFLTRMLTEFGISGTTLTVNKEDGTTAVATFTLDSSTAPTAITRAT